MPPRDSNEPVKSYVDPRIDIYAPTSDPYFRIRGYDRYGNRVVDTNGGRSLKTAQEKAARIARKLRRGVRERSRDPGRVLAHAEAAEWLVPTNHRTRENKPWSMGSDVRVDAVLEPPELELWHPNSRVWVLEAKKPVPGDAKDHAALVAQAVDYRYVNWDGFGPLPVMIWPEPFRTHIGGDTNTVARSILSKFGVLCWLGGDVGR